MDISKILTYLYFYQMIIYDKTYIRNGFAKKLRVDLCKRTLKISKRVIHFQSLYCSILFDIKNRHMTCFFFFHISHYLSRTSKPKLLYGIDFDSGQSREY